MSGHHDFRILEAKMSPESRARSEAEAAKMIAEMGKEGAEGGGCRGCGQCDSELGIGSVTEPAQPEKRPNCYSEKCIYRLDSRVSCSKEVLRGALGVVAVEVPHFVVYDGQKIPHNALPIFRGLVCSTCIQERGIPKEIIGDRIVV